jgi:hypothetical protein
MVATNSTTSGSSSNAIMAKGSHDGENKKGQARLKSSTSKSMATISVQDSSA